MIKENQRLLNQLHILSDGLLILLAMLGAYWVRFFLMDGTVSFTSRAFWGLTAAAVALCMVSYAVAGLYQSYRAVRFHKEVQRLFLATALDTVILLALLFVFRLEEVSRWMLGFFGGLNFFFLACKRAALRLTLRYFRRLGYNQKHVVLVGDGPMAAEYVNKVRTDKNLGYQIAGYVSIRRALNDVNWLGDYTQLEEILTRINPDEVVVAMPPMDFRLTGKIINVCEKTGIKLSLIPFYAEYMPSNPQVDNIDGLPMINLRRIPLDNMGNAFLKRCMDIVGAAALILLTSPLMLVAAIGVKLSSPGPILFKQERVGKHNKTFYMYKFRSMRINAEEKTGWSRDTDPRKTKFGSFIRKFSIDELPQFFNVLKGDMSLVGPRPEVPHFVEQFKEEIPRYMVKHQVRPGITGWAQVNGFRGDTSIKRRIEHDLYYIENWSVFFDVKILLMTLSKAKNSEKLVK